MENRKFIRFFIPILALGFFIFGGGRAFAYGIDTHAFLTSAIFHFYNEHFPKQSIHNDLWNFLIDGARREDDTPRWMNHFYDPVYNRGLTDVFLGTWQKSKEWAQDSKNQNSLVYKAPATIASILTAIQQKKISEISTETNFAWQKAIDYYVAGKQEQAMFTLGHVLHLVEDASVPDHTRNDPHPGDSPYETWTEQFTLARPDQKLAERLISKNPIVRDSLDDYFDAIAKYSNNNFYSKNTIGLQSSYEEPVPDTFELIGEQYYAIKKDESGELYKIFLKKTRRGSLMRPFEFELTLEDALVKSDYWSRLSVKAVQYGAGVIDLFFREAEKAKKEKEEKAKKETGGAGGLFAQVADAVAGLLRVGQGTPSAEQIPGLAEIPRAPFAKGGMSDLSDEADQTDQAGTDGVNSRESPGGSPSEDAGSINAGEVEPLKTAPQESDIPKDSGGGYAHSGRAPENSSSTNTESGNSPAGQANATNTAAGGGSQNNTPAPPQSESATTTTAMPSVAASHAVISEVQIEGVDAGDEFIELYNPTDAVIDVSNWSIQYLSGTASSAASVSKKNFETGAAISARGFFLIARATSTNGTDGYRTTRTPDMTHRSFSLSGAATGATIVLVNDQEKITGADDPNIIDRLAYGTGSGLLPEGSAAPAPASSFERKAVSGSECVSPIGLADLTGPWGEFAGNACDRDDNSRDFVLRAAPNPQNAANLPEPRAAPAAPTNIQFTYATSTLDLTLQWTPSADAAGATSTITYEATSSLGLIGRISPLGTKTQKLSEIGRDYGFALSATDADGFRSAAAAATATPAGLFESFYFYRDPAQNGVYRIDALLPPSFPGDVSPTTWNLLVLYLNRDPAAIPLFYADAQYASVVGSPAHDYGEWGSSVGEAQPFVYRNCANATTTSTALLIPGTRSLCQPAQPGIRGTGIHSDSLEDRRLRASLSGDLTSLGPGSYLTAALYTYRGFNTEELVVRDLTKYYFGTTTPENLPPTAPADIQFSYGADEATTTVTVSWLPSTDLDSLDAGILYEWRATAGSSTLPDHWQAVELWGGPGSDVRRMMRVPRALGQAHVFEIRAKDDQGAASAAGGATLFLPPLETCAERAARNPYFAIDCVMRAGNEIKIRWRLLQNPGEGSVWALFPYLSARESAPSTNRALHRAPNGNPDYPKTTFKTTAQCNEAITHLDEYRIGRQYLTKFTELSGRAAQTIVPGAIVAFSMFRGSPCAINAAADTPFYSDTAEYAAE